jgi:hypothetical protein
MPLNREAMGLFSPGRLFTLFLLLNAAGRYGGGIVPFVDDGLQYFFVDSGEMFGKIGGRDSAHFNEFDHDFLGHLQGLLFGFVHDILDEGKNRPAGKWV